MAEEKKKRGRPASGVNTVDIHYKMSKELFDALPKDIKRNTYINDAVREKMLRDGFLSPKDWVSFPISQVRKMGNVGKAGNQIIPNLPVSHN